MQNPLGGGLGIDQMTDTFDSIYELSALLTTRQLQRILQPWDIFCRIGKDRFPTSPFGSLSSDWKDDIMAKLEYLGGVSVHEVCCCPSMIRFLVTDDLCVPGTLISPTKVFMFGPP